MGCSESITSATIEITNRGSGTVTPVGENGVVPSINWLRGERRPKFFPASEPRFVNWSGWGICTSKWSRLTDE